MLDLNENRSQQAYGLYAPFSHHLITKSNLHSEYRIQYIMFHIMGLHYIGE